MGHARHEDLLDIADVLEKVRTLPGVLERSPGIFYVGRTPFLHFHTKAGDRWADAKAGREWGPEIPLPFGSRARMKSLFLREIRSRYEACAKAGEQSTAVPSKRLGRIRGETARHGRAGSPGGRSAGR